MKFKNAIVRQPCPEMVMGITSAQLGKPDFDKALEQHARYVEILEACGLQVTILNADSRFPDSTFVEDVALCTSRFAVLTNPGAASRNGEKAEMKPVLQQSFQTVEEIHSPGTLDAGDVMMVGDHYFIGVSERTNDDGAEQLIGLLSKHKMTGSKVPLKTMLHLKTGLSYLEKNVLLVSGEFISRGEFDSFDKIIVDEGDCYAANSLWVNNRVIVPAGYPETKAKIERAGYATIEIDVSEFRKLDGGLSCLSLRF